MAMPPRELQAVRQQHMLRLTLRQLQVLSACEFGYTVDEIALGLGISSATIRRHLAELEHRVFGLTSLTPTHTLLSKWAREHSECCTKSCQQLFENNQIFDQTDHRRRN